MSSHGAHAGKRCDAVSHRGLRDSAQANTAFPAGVPRRPMRVHPSRSEAFVRVRAFVLRSAAGMQLPGVGSWSCSAGRRRSRIPTIGRPLLCDGQANGEPVAAGSTRHSRGGGDAPSCSALMLDGAFPGKPTKRPDVVVQIAQRLARFVSADFQHLVRRLNQSVAAESPDPSRWTSVGNCSADGAGASGFLTLPSGVTVEVCVLCLAVHVCCSVLTLCFVFCACVLVCTQFVDTLPAARKAVKHILRTKWKQTAIPGHGVIGIDTEWQPSTQHPTAVMQIATLDAVFVFDVPHLHRCFGDKVGIPCSHVGRRPCSGSAVCVMCAQWESLVRRVLMARNVIKTGYGLQGDLERLAKYVAQHTPWRHAGAVRHVPVSLRWLPPGHTRTRCATAPHAKCSTPTTSGVTWQARCRPAAPTPLSAAPTAVEGWRDWSTLPSGGTWTSASSARRGMTGR